MPVNLHSPDAQDLLVVPGVRLGVASAGIRKANRLDLLLIQLSAGTQCAGVFTRNAMCAAPVLVAKEHLALSDGAVRALVVNTGVANAGTGARGLDAARDSCSKVAALLRCSTKEVLPFSTGVILEHLPVDRLAAGLPACVTNASSDGEAWLAAARAIMTTDTLPKAVSRALDIDGVTVNVSGIAKGSGMIHPNMATMLGFVATDAKLAPGLLDELVRQMADASFNCISVDGDTSTNDSLILIATGQATQTPIERASDVRYGVLRDGLIDVATRLAQAIVRDGEGATKFITIAVNGGASLEECRLVGYAVARSPLVKTAFFASDPNLGRILSAIGNAGLASLDISKVRVFLDDVLVAEQGGRAQSYTETAGQRVMMQEEILVSIELGRGEHHGAIWTCDLSHDYIKINAEYRT